MSSDQAVPTDGDSPVFETANGYISLVGGILVIRTKGGQGTEASFAEALDVIERLVDGVARPALWDTRLWQGATPEAWGHLVRRIAHFVSAVAMLVPNDQDHSVGPFPEAIGRLLIPFRVFTDEQEGLAYLRGFAGRD